MKVKTVWANSQEELETKINNELKDDDYRNFVSMTQSTYQPDATTDVAIICVTILLQ